MSVLFWRSSSSLRPVQLVTALLGVLIGYLLLPGSAAGQQDEYDEWRQRQKREYQEYLSEQDKAFLQFLEKKWTDVEVGDQAGSPIDEKPEEMPVVDGMDQETPSVKPMGSGSVSTEPVGSEQTEPGRPPVERPSESPGLSAEASKKEENETEPSSPEEAGPNPTPENERSSGMSQTSLSFFGVHTTIPYNSELTPAVEGDIGEEAIRTYWQSMAEADYSSTVDAIQRQREELALSDWGYYLYVRDLGNQLYGVGAGPDDKREATLWTWFIMMKSGYAVRVGYRQEEVFLMLPVDGQIFNRPQLRIDGHRFYLMVDEGADGSLRTYEGHHDSADQVLQLDERRVPTLEQSTQSRSVSFSYDSDRYTIEFAYNTAVLDYLQAYPNVQLEVLFEAGVSPAAESSLRDALQPHVEDRSPREALTFLLRFVQFATEYKRDRENFGEERFLFPEESLAAAASDCEDRAVLFAYLARTLMERQVVGLQWPGHVATAVKDGKGLDATPDDWTVSVGGATYIMADPTYIGSSVGMEMPFVGGKEPDILSFRQ